MGVLHALRRLGWKAGVDIRRLPTGGASTRDVPVELSSKEKDLVTWILESKYTMGSPQRLFATALALKHLISEGRVGSFVECGVWRGGHSLLAAGIFALNDVENRVFLFDTFAGMTEPTAEDVMAEDGTSAMPLYVAHKDLNYNNWCFASLDEVRGNFAARGLLTDRVQFVEGPVEKTLLLESNLPTQISFLRLDTDFYASTVTEMEVLYRRLEVGGVFAVDDYGHWAGARQAVDEYFQRGSTPAPMLNYVDYTCRIGQRLA